VAAVLPGRQRHRHPAGRVPDGMGRGRLRGGAAHRPGRAPPGDPTRRTGPVPAAGRGVAVRSRQRHDGGMADPKKTLTSAEIVDAVPAGWTQDGQTLTVRFATGDFATGLELVNRIGASAEEANHNPDLTLTYPEVTVTLSSHDVGGISSRDLDLARRASAHAAALDVAPAVGGPRRRDPAGGRADAVCPLRSGHTAQDRYGSVALQGSITRGRTLVLWWDRRILPAVTLPGSRRAPVRAWSQRPRRRGAHTMRIGRRTFATLGPLAALGLLAACSDDGGGGGGGGEG